MFLVGLTGGIGSGKSEAARVFRELGVPVIDTDAIAHELTASGHPVLKKIIAQFGNTYMLADQSLDRAALRKKVFADKEARLQLESILHPAIYEAVLQAIQQHSEAPYQVIAVPLLFESERYRKLVNRTLLIDCDENLQISRTTARSGLSPTEVEAIMRAQMPRAERLRKADDIISNNESLTNLRQKVEDIHKDYMQACIVNE
ncbi:MAG: dephospho-CoA kinase [Betaproteobacteria bacterium HGW-Betaproteobacteria-1]|jgi:dephospho-CoA kinase|nr:MAG: dephospho-CoA kinase [Betaproteobacteria bacterium HGW-Betaproteobacteria-1]